MNTDILIVGSGCAGLYCALNLPSDKEILMITKESVERSDSFLAQGGMCTLTSEDDYRSYFDDTMKAGHYENNKKAVEVMIRSSRDVLEDLISYGARFACDDEGNLLYTREGAHSRSRIVYHRDVTGREITSHLYEAAKTLTNLTIREYWAMVDIVTEGNLCRGVVVRKPDGTLDTIWADYIVLACGGIGGIFKYSTNYHHLTGDGVTAALRHNVEVEHISYIQTHPTTFYTGKKKERSFLISESVRGEGALLYNNKGCRFTNELKPRDVVTHEIKKEMKKEGTDHVWLSMQPIDEDEINQHFPHIVEYCREHGYDVTKEMIPVTPAQHYFMGGIRVNLNSRTSMERLYAIGETACNGVHGKNRLASNSLLESMVFAKRAAREIGDTYEVGAVINDLAVDYSLYADEKKWEGDNKKLLQDAIKKEKEELDPEKKSDAGGGRKAGRIIRLIKDRIHRADAML